MAQWVESPSAMQDTRDLGSGPGQEDLLDKETAAQSGILA